MKDFIEYTDNGDGYEHPERTEVTEVLNIRLYCDWHEEDPQAFTADDDYESTAKCCNKYIKGKEGYNGMFTAETGQNADLRNQSFVCTEHSDVYDKKAAKVKKQNSENI